MREIGVFEAKTRLSELLEKVATGEEFLTHPSRSRDCAAGARGPAPRGRDPPGGAGNVTFPGRPGAGRGLDVPARQRPSRQHALTAYDAAYLELARRLDLPLATRNEALARAAAQAGVRLLPA